TKSALPFVQLAESRTKPAFNAAVRQHNPPASGIIGLHKRLYHQFLPISSRRTRDFDIIQLSFCSVCHRWTESRRPTFLPLQIIRAITSYDEKHLGDRCHGHDWPRGRETSRRTRGVNPRGRA